MSALTPCTPSPFLPQVVSEIATTVLDQLAEGQALRAGVPLLTLFPMLPRARQMLHRRLMA